MPANPSHPPPPPRPTLRGGGQPCTDSQPLFKPLVTAFATALDAPPPPHKCMSGTSLSSGVLCALIDPVTPRPWASGGARSHSGRAQGMAGGGGGGAVWDRGTRCQCAPRAFIRQRSLSCGGGGSGGGGGGARLIRTVNQSLGPPAPKSSGFGGWVGGSITVERFSRNGGRIMAVPPPGLSLIKISGRRCIQH